MARIYLSSTFADLRPYRDAVYRTLRRMDHDVVAMEDMTAEDARPLASCYADIDSCVLFIGILGWRRGFAPVEGNGVAITELEYEHASGRMPRLMFLLSPAVPWPAEHTDPPDAQPAIHAFRKRVEDAHVAMYFENPDQLATSVAVSVRKWEIDSGYRPPPPPLELPAEVDARLIEYEPYDKVSLRFRMNFGAVVFQSVFLAIWTGLLLLALWSAFAQGEPGCQTVLLLVFTIAMAFLFIRRRTITFDLKNGWVTISTPGSINRSRPVSHVLELVTRRRRGGWVASLWYGPCELARTAPQTNAEAARARLRPFALALNQQLGLLDLREKRIGG